jgi:hypothetical protein
MAQPLYDPLRERLIAVPGERFFQADGNGANGIRQNFREARTQLLTLEANNPENFYRLALELDDGAARYQVNNIYEVFQAIEFHTGSSNAMRMALTGEDTTLLEGASYMIYRVQDLDPALQPNMQANSNLSYTRTASNITNCVLRQVVEDFCYYKENGERRALAWEDNHKLSFSCVVAKMKKHLAFKNLLSAVRDFTADYNRARANDTRPMGLDVRNLVTFADLAKCRIRIWMPMGTSNTASNRRRSLRWDTDTHASEECKNAHKRHTYDFYLTSNDHAQIFERSERSDKNLKKEGDLSCRRYKLCSDADFKRMSKGERHLTPESHPQILSVLQYVPQSFLDPSVVDNPEGDPTKYGGYILDDGTYLYFHRRTYEWLRSRYDSDEDFDAGPKYVAPHQETILNLKRAHSRNRVYPMSQHSDPRTYYAVVSSDHAPSMAGHDPGIDQSRWEVDMKACYGADFAAILGDLFLGYPSSDKFEEYDCRFGFELTVLLGNSPPDRHFDFSKQYAIMQIQSLDFSEAHPGIRDLMVRKLGAFGGADVYRYNDEKDNGLFLHSPIVNWLQQNGVVWRVSRVWITRHTMRSWTEGMSESELQTMSQKKHYQQAVGSMFGGRKSHVCKRFWVPDDETANSIRQFYSPMCEETDDQARFVLRDRPQRRCEDLQGAGLTDGRLSEYLSESGESGFYGPLLSGMDVKQIDNGSVLGKEVICWDDITGMGRTKAHISGAVHAYALIAVWQGIKRLPADIVLAVKTDAAVCTSDPTPYMQDLIDPSTPGMFKDPEFIPGISREQACLDELAYDLAMTGRQGTCVMTETFVPVRRSSNMFPGGLEPITRSPLFSDYHANRRTVSFITGEAGTGKTFGSFDTELFTDRLMPRGTSFCTYTNHLSNVMRKRFPAVRCYTVHKTFNRQVDDESRKTQADRRFDKKNGKPVRNLASGSHTVFVDEASFLSPEMLADVLEVCREYKINIVFSMDADIHRRRLYQLSAPSSGGEVAFFRALDEWFGVPGREPYSVHTLERNYRQSGSDPYLLEVLRKVRHRELAWPDLFGLGFNSCGFAKMASSIDPGSDLVVTDCHNRIRAITRSVVGRLKQSDRIRIRANSQFEFKDSDPSFLRDLDISGSGRVPPGPVCEISFYEFESLRGSRFMKRGWPYCHDTQTPDDPASTPKTCTNLIQPMIACTPYKCQGLTLYRSKGSNLYLYGTNKSFATDDSNPIDKNSLYTALSRPESGSQVVLVDPERSRLGKRQSSSLSASF